MNKLIVITLFFSFASCSTGHNKSEGVFKMNSENETSVSIIDSLRNPNHYYYLADLDPRLYAELVLNDSVQPGDNFSTFRIIDSLESYSMVDRAFYFKVFLKIKEKSDGALTDAIGLPTLVFAENHTKELLKFSSNYPVEVLASWGYTVGLEIMMSTNNQSSIDSINKFYRKLQDNCNDCSETEMIKLADFYAAMLESIKQNKE